jgi:hypothetical protein
MIAQIPGRVARRIVLDGPVGKSHFSNFVIIAGILKIYFYELKVPFLHYLLFINPSFH